MTSIRNIFSMNVRHAIENTKELSPNNFIITSKGNLKVFEGFWKPPLRFVWQNFGHLILVKYLFGVDDNKLRSLIKEKLSHLDEKNPTRALLQENVELFENLGRFKLNNLEKPDALELHKRIQAIHMNQLNGN